MARDRLSGLPSTARVLFMRTPSTGRWLDSISVPSHVHVDRIAYESPFQLRMRRGLSTAFVSGTRKVADADVIQTLHELSQEGLYDLVCLDSFHDFETSLRDLNSAFSLLKPDGLLLSHDCFPACAALAGAHFQAGGWCGMTFAAFIVVAYAHPDAYFCVHKPDTGIGMMSKTLQGFSSPRNEELFAEFSALLATALELSEESPDSKGIAMAAASTASSDAAEAADAACAALWTFVHVHGPAFSGLIEEV
jgi:hypothetical protein